MTKPALQPMVDTSTPILVLRRSFAPLQHGVLGVARSAGRVGIPVHAVAMHPREPAISSRYIRRAFSLGHDLPASDAPDAAWLDGLLNLPAEVGRPLLIPIDDLGAVFVCDHRGALAERFLLPAQPDGVERTLAGRRTLFERSREFGIAVPDASFVEDERAAVEEAERLGFPLVLKQAEPWMHEATRSAPSVLIARDRQMLLTGFRRMRTGTPARQGSGESASTEVMLQEYIPGGSESVWMFNGYFGTDSSCVCSFTGRKLRQRGPRTGPTTLGVCVENPAVTEAAQRLLGSLGYRGIVDMGFRYDERDGSYKLLDANPRLGSTFRLFVAENGLDVVRAEYLDLTGQHVQIARARNGRKWIVEPYDAFVCGQLAGEGSLSARAWLRSLQGVEEGAWWAQDDPRPFWLMCSSVGLDLPSYISRRRADRSWAQLNGNTPTLAEQPVTR